MKPLHEYPTPETDEALKARGKQCTPTGFFPYTELPSDFARNLEQRLAQTEDLRLAADAGRRADRHQLTKERDEAREKLAAFRKALKEIDCSSVNGIDYQYEFYKTISIVRRTLELTI